MYALSANGWRAIASAEDAAVGETVVEAIPEAAIAAAEVIEGRARRNTLLRSTDWTQSTDAPLNLAARQAWADYRTALRNLPQVPGFPNVGWPVPPTLLDGLAGTGDPTS